MSKKSNKFEILIKIEFFIRKLKPPLPEITNKFNAGIKGESLKTQYKNEDVNENNYISGWSFVSHNKKL